jgi:hypothetical protein
MSEKPEDGVLNKFGQAHDVPNLFVSDGSQFTTGAAANPTLTIVALAIRRRTISPSRCRKTAFRRHRRRERTAERRLLAPQPGNAKGGKRMQAARLHKYDDSIPRTASRSNR